MPSRTDLCGLAQLGLDRCRDPCVAGSLRPVLSSDQVIGHDPKVSGHPGNTGRGEVAVIESIAMEDRVWPT